MRARYHVMLLAHIKRSIVVLLLLVLVAVMPAFSSTAVPLRTGREFQIKVHDINQVEMSISNFGKFGQIDRGTAGCWWPT